MTHSCPILCEALSMEGPGALCSRLVTSSRSSAGRQLGTTVRVELGALQNC